MHYKSVAAGLGLLSLSAAAPTPTIDEPTRVVKSRSLEELFGRDLAPLVGRDSTATVSGPAAVFTINNNDGIGAGSGTYTYYSGDGSTGQGWPAQSQWVSFVDMFNNNKNNMFHSCEQFNVADDSGPEVGAIYNGIQAIAQQSGVDHRFILAVIMQESGGCVRAPTTSNSFANPGLMQDFQGYYTCNDNTNIEGDNYAVRNPCPTNYITQMIREGAVGTDTGDGLASNINTSENDGASGAQVFYRAARYYNSGQVCGTNLSDGCDATPSYSSDIANRLTGWTG